MDYTIQNFINKLITEKGANDVPEEVKTQLKADLMERIEKVINLKIIENLDEENLTKFENKLDYGTDSDVQNFLKEAIPNIDNLVAEALLDFRQKYLGLTA